MKKLTFLLIAILSILAMAAQKPCGEVFPNAGIKATLGLDGSRCVVSILKGESGEVTSKFMVSQDHSLIRIETKSRSIKDGKKENHYANIRCEDVGAGQRFECDLDRDDFKGKKIFTPLHLLGTFQTLASDIDIQYLFDGQYPWDNPMGW